MLTVFRPPGIHGSDRPVIALHRKSDVVDAVADLDLRQDTLIMFGVRGGFIEILIHLVKKFDGAHKSTSWFG